MQRWSYIRNQLEQEYLAESLKGRIRYFVTTYRKSHDQEGKAVILLDGREIVSGDYWHMEHPDFFAYTQVDADRLERGAFDQHSFYAAFAELNGQSIDESLVSDNLLVRIFAILDRRTGKRRLLAMQERMQQEPEALRYFYRLRSEAEGLKTAIV